MLLTDSCNTCYLLRNFYFFLRGYYATVSRKVRLHLNVNELFMILLRNILVIYHYFSSGNCCCQYFPVTSGDCHLIVIFLIAPSNKKKNLPANNQILERDPLMSLFQVLTPQFLKHLFFYRLPIGSYRFSTLQLGKGILKDDVLLSN